MWKVWRFRGFRISECLVVEDVVFVRAVGSGLACREVYGLWNK